MKGFDTRAVHGGREEFRKMGVHASPIDLSSTYPIPDFDEGTRSFAAWGAGEGEAANSIYGRFHNPTVARMEHAIAGLEGTDACIAFASGMAAITALLLSRRAHGNHVLVVRPLYAATDSLLANGLLGFDAEFVGADEIAAKIRPDTTLVVIETPANPTCDLVDIRAVVQAAGKVPVMVDSTFATPVLQRPVELGASYVVHSATKFLGGHGDVIAGVVCCSEELAKPLRKVRISTGANLHPLAAFLIHRGLPTLGLRVERAQANAIELAKRLSQHLAVVKVFHPSLGTVNNSHLVGTQMSGPGSLMAIDLKGGHTAASKVMNSVKLMVPAVSLGAVDTLIQHPAGLTHRSIPAETLGKYGITAGMLRVSVGIENAEDLWADFEQALSGL